MAITSNRLSIVRGSDIFPTISLVFPGQLFNYPIKVGFWHKSSMKIMPNGKWKPATHLPDLELEITSDGTPQLWYYLGAKMLVLAYYNVPTNVVRITGKISSVPDLNGGYVEVKRLDWDFTKQTHNYEKLTTLQLTTNLMRIGFLISNQEYTFDRKDMQYSLKRQTNGNPAPSFNFRFDIKKSQQYTNAFTSEW